MTRVAFDTSVLVAAVVRDHPAHDRAVVWLADSATIERTASWHAIAECWATLTRLPVKPRLTPAVVSRVIDRLRQILVLVDPAAATYAEALRRCAHRQVVSGVVYDALHLASARDAGAAALVTLSPRDFERVWENGDPEIVEPPAPPCVPDRFAGP